MKSMMIVLIAGTKPALAKKTETMNKIHSTTINRNRLECNMSGNLKTLSSVVPIKADAASPHKANITKMAGKVYAVTPTRTSVDPIDRVCCKGKGNNINQRAYVAIDDFFLFPLA